MFEFKEMKRVFKDEKMQETFEREGFVVVDFYNPEQIEEVKNLYRKLHPKDEKGFFSSCLSQDLKYRESVDFELKKIADHLFKELFIDYQIVGGLFVVKSPTENSLIDVHQDMTLVDEQDYTAINLWATTLDLTDENGVMYVLPGSHRFFQTYRGPTIPDICNSIKKDIKNYMVPCYLKAGQALVFDHRAIHFTTPNTSEDLRIVSNFYFTQKNAKFLICYHDKNNPEFKGKVELFGQDSSFMIKYKQFGYVLDRPKIGKSLGLKDYNFPQLTIEQLENQFGKKRLREYTPSKKVEKFLEKEYSIDQPKNQLKESLSFWKVYNPINILKGIKSKINV